MWRIDRLTHKKLADIGSRTILSAWFDNNGAKLVMVEQCTVDEFRVVVCSPQTMEIKLEDNAIKISSYQVTVSTYVCCITTKSVDLLITLFSHCAEHQLSPLVLYCSQASSSASNMSFISYRIL